MTPFDTPGAIATQVPNTPSSRKTNHSRLFYFFSHN